MNELVQELADRLWRIHPKDIDAMGLKTRKEFYEQELKKFAELMVEECVTTVLKESKWYWDKDEFESSNAIQNAARRVKEHFGVSE